MKLVELVKDIGVWEIPSQGYEKIIESNIKDWDHLCGGRADKKKQPSI